MTTPPTPRLANPRPASAARSAGRGPRHLWRVKALICAWDPQFGGHCHHAAVMFRYGIFPKAEAQLVRHEITLSCLCYWWDVLREAQAQGAFEVDDLRRLEDFLKAPYEWQDSFERTHP
ncbi:MAG: hypothetical protein GDA40_12460 [Rhodobacteraceae bacterium]|nr:hypothetical protein [Paracoccaceae bacterium]